MKVSISAHPLLGAHNRIAREHSDKRAELQKLVAQLKLVRTKVASENERRKAKVATLVKRIRALENKKALVTDRPTRLKLAATIKELRIGMKDLQLEGPSSTKLQTLIKQKKKLITVIEDLRHSHSASLALRQLYALRKWTD